MVQSEAKTFKPQPWGHGFGLICDKNDIGRWPSAPDKDPNGSKNIFIRLVHFMGSAFELQLVRRGIPPEALKRGEPEMVKGKWRVAGSDDPIFNGKCVISSPSKPKSKPITPQESSLTDTIGQSANTKKEEKIDE